MLRTFNVRVWFFFKLNYQCYSRSRLKFLFLLTCFRKSLNHKSRTLPKTTAADRSGVKFLPSSSMQFGSSYEQGLLSVNDLQLHWCCFSRTAVTDFTAPQKCPPHPEKPLRPSFTSTYFWTLGVICFDWIPWVIQNTRETPCKPPWISLRKD